jgi:hypothetical protein
MKKNRTLFQRLFLICLLLGCLCSFEALNAETFFPETKALHGRTIPIDTALFRYPWRIRVNGDRAVVEDLHGPDYFFHLFSYPDFRYLSSFSKRGEGPEEMLQAENFRWEGDDLWTLDCNKSEMVQWRFNICRDSLLRHRVVKLQKELLRPLDFAIYSGTCFLIPDYSGDNRFCWVDRQGKLLRKTGDFPTTNKKALKESRPALAQAWRSFIDYNPRNGVLVAATQLGEVLEVYNLKKNTHVVKVSGQGEPQFMVSREGYGIPTGIKGYGDVQVTDSAIYTTFEGETFKDIANNNKKGIRAPNGGNRIYVYTLEGEPLRKYELDHSVEGIWVDEDKGIILAVDGNQDEPIVEFKM